MARKAKHVQILDERIEAEEAAIAALEGAINDNKRMLQTLKDVRDSFIEASPRRKKVTA